MTTAPATGSLGRCSKCFADCSALRSEQLDRAGTEEEETALPVVPVVVPLRLAVVPLDTVDIDVHPEAVLAPEIEAGRVRPLDPDGVRVTRLGEVLHLPVADPPVEPARGVAAHPPLEDQDPPAAE